LTPREPIPTYETLPLRIETARLVLRPWELGDVDAIWSTVSDPTFPIHMTWAAHTDRAQTVAFVELHQRLLAEQKSIGWAITRDGVVVGCISLDGIRWTMNAARVDQANLGFWTARDHWRQGYMTEAVEAVLGFAFGPLGLHKVYVAHVEGNEGSRRVIEKVGFRPVGRLEEEHYRDGRWWSGMRYELTAGEHLDSSRTMRINTRRQP
jgi:ribosomal-protein-alanine N-acetyltransferase